ncbi:unnamed protein product [Rhodiola kirilowii]
MNDASFQPSIPVLDGKNNERCSTQMRVLLEYQEILEVIDDGVKKIGDTATDAEKQKHREQNKKKDKKALFFIHQGANDGVFQKIVGTKNIKRTRDILANSFKGVDKVNKVKLQTLRRQTSSQSMSVSPFKDIH